MRRVPASTGLPYGCPEPPCLPHKGGEDYDCNGGDGNGPLFTSPGVVYTVTGSDPYDLDGNGDGKACG